MKVLSALVLLGAPGCGLVGESSSSAQAAAGGKVLVVATTTQVADFVRNIGGPHVFLHAILRPNTDPHDYEVSPADIDALARARLVVQNGVGLEPWLPDAVKSGGGRAPVVDSSAGVHLRSGRGEAGHDPHIWQSPANALAMCRTIERGLARVDPARAPAYRARLARYSARLRALDADIRHRLAGLRDRRLVTNHDAFGYFIDRYGLRLEGSIIPSFDTSAELSARDVSGLVARIRARRVRAVFSESSLPPGTAAVIARRAGVRVVAGERALYGDSLGPRGSDGATYLTMMEHNAMTIARNLR